MSLQRQAWLLQNMINNFPISGDLSLGDDGRLKFVLDAGAGGCFLGWLEKRLETEHLKDRIAQGERPVVLDLPVSQATISWPKTLGGYGMKLEDGQHTWLITLDYPSGPGISQIANMFSSKKTSKPWKDALAAVRSE